jgi:hypothetical protein
MRWHRSTGIGEPATGKRTSGVPRVIAGLFSLLRLRGRDGLGERLECRTVKRRIVVAVVFQLPLRDFSGF